MIFILCSLLQLNQLYFFTFDSSIIFQSRSDNREREMIYIYLKEFERNVVPNISKNEETFDKKKE